MTNSPFVPTTLGRLTLKNRFIRSATWDGMGLNDGTFSPAQIELFQRLFDRRYIVVFETL